MDEGDIKRLGEWLAPRLGLTSVAVRDVEALSTGYSAETISLWVEGGESSRRMVLRRESPDPAVYPQQAAGYDIEVDIQHRVMSALTAGTDIPLAPVIGYEGSSGVVGAPFFVMDFVEGSIPEVAPSYAQAGFFADATPADRWRMIDDGVRVLAQLHTLDWEKHGMGWLLPDGQEPTAQRQVDIWKAYLVRELKGREHPLVMDAFSWLEARRPEHDPTSVVLNWGDPRLGNMIWRDFACVCVTDFEAASIAPFGVDLGWWLMFDRWSHEQSDAVRLEGEPTREQQAARYFELSGRAPESTHWYEVFAAVRYSAIVVRVINRTVDRGLMPAENDYWRENQSTACLEELLS